MASARYRILRRLGQGGMAEVFEAELAGELGFSRKVAIKRMLADAAADPESARRFLDEARIASRLHDANIVSVIDVGLLDGLPFQVLELVDGLNAHQLQQRAGGLLPLEVALIIIGDVAHALDHAHNAHVDGRPLGIVHRDVKPSNVLVSWGGDVKLTDFGIAFAHDRASKTEAGLVPGTRGYIAPEQRTHGEIDGRTDVFALGLSLHTLLCGYNPLEDITVEMAAITGQPIPLDAMLQPQIRDLIARAVTPERRDRVTAAQFADAVGAVLAPRLQRDSRGYLRQFLDPLHEDRPKPGALDQLLGLDVVLTSDGAGDAPRRYELRPTVVAKPSRSSTAGPTVDRSAGKRTDPDPGASYGETQDDDRASAPPRRRVGRLLAGAVLVGGLGGLAALQLRNYDQPVALRDAAVATTSPLNAEQVAAAPVDAAEIIIDAGAIVQAEPDAGVRISEQPARRLPVARVDAGAATTATAPPVAGTGYLQVVGEDNLGAKILVDGREAGYAPNKLEVPRGHHRLTIVRKDGTQASGEIDVTEYHTVGKPLRPAL